MAQVKLKENMTPSPFQISCDMLAKDAYHIMIENEIRHLPVIKDAKIIGVISDRDLRLVIENDSELDGRSKYTKVEELMTKNPYVVNRGEPIENVVHEMWKNKYGCAIVVNHGHWIAGIFTTTDALALLEKLLLNRKPPKKESIGSLDQY